MLGFVYQILVKYWYASSIMITLKINMVTTQDYYSLILIVWCIKLKPKKLMKILVRIKKFWILVITQLVQSIKMNQTN